MTNLKRSFLSDILGPNTYDNFRIIGRIAVPIGIVLVAVVVMLTQHFHNGFLCELLWWLSGTSIPFVLLLVATATLLDVRVEIEEPYSWEIGKKKTPMPLRYKLTTAWAVVLIALAIAAMYFSNKYYKHYSFECETFFVDFKAKVYHLDYDNDCKDAELAHKNGTFDRLHGYEIEGEYTPCAYCEEWAEDAEDAAKADR